ncbi:MAG TPA: ABC transporter ATP-binding protein [Anaerolineaceae bacterium]|nr:ABC transporter ATP-binding protein [Anaerolineaceae bacterium]HPN50584.1 ABC transporter ATP-binding protein [Anaerolineaceae bacterium]
MNDSPHSAAPAIRCSGLTRRYGEVTALDNLNLEVPAGSVFGFLGRNGAGKTTTIRLITGLAHPTAGSAWVAGVETTSGDSTARLQFGYLPQSPAFYKWMNPREYLDYIAGLFELPASNRKKRIMETLEKVGLQDAVRRRIGGFSGGMVQRLGIAQAILHNPPVLFLDEPTSALDPAGRYEVLDLMERLRGQVTIFFSTHILSDVERVCDTIAIIHQGKLVLVSDRQALLEKYSVNAVELELVEDASLPAAFLEEVKAQAWFNSLTHADKILRISVNQLEASRQALLPIIARHGLVLARYEWVRPSLEEIFLKISS